MMKKTSLKKPLVHACIQLEHKLIVENTVMGD